MSEQDTFCNIAVDYAQFMADAVLPFQVALDLEQSDLLPALGKNQKFCYTITGVDTGKPRSADLRHLVFGLCSQITAKDLKSVLISVDGEEQAAVMGQNVVFVNPDPQTGCCGLKFSFGLRRAGGCMKLSYELVAPYPVGPVPVSLFGDSTSVSGLSICGPVCEGTQVYETVGVQNATVCVPVTVTPFAKTGCLKIIAYEAPVVTPDVRVGCRRAGSCHFTVIQKIGISVPGVFGASANVGELTVECDPAEPSEQRTS